MVAVVAALGAMPGVAQAAFPGVNGRIAYSWPPGIFTMDPNGAAHQQLTADLEGNPAWSPNGQRIAFSDRNANIAVINADGSGREVLTTSPGASNAHPTWSPDGGRIAFIRGVSGIRQLFVMNADGSNVQQLTTDPVDHGTPSWSPDGHLIAFSSGNFPNDDIHVIAPDGTNRHALTTSTARESDPDWSPDGDRIVYSRGITTDTVLMVMNADGSGQHAITPPAAQMPAWSPDGQRIVFQALGAGLFTMNADGSGGRVWTGVEDGAFPAWGTNPVLGGPAPALQECSDGIDNDGDGRFDYPADLACASHFDDVEAGRIGMFLCRASAIRIAQDEPFVANPTPSPSGFLRQCVDDAAAASRLPLGMGVPSVTVAELAAETDVAPDDPDNTAPAAGDHGLASAAAGKVTIQLGATEIVLERVQSEAAVTCGGTPLRPIVSDSSSVGRLRVAGLTIPAGDTPLSLPIGGWTLHLNHSSEDPTPEVRRRAVWLQSPDGTQDVVVAESRAGHFRPCDQQ